MEELITDFWSNYWNQNMGIAWKILFLPIVVLQYISLWLPVLAALLLICFGWYSIFAFLRHVICN